MSAVPSRSAPRAGVLVDHPVARLSFVASRDGKVLPKPTGRRFPRCFWHVKPTGDYTVDCITGRALALEYLAYEEARIGDPTLLAWIVEDMPQKRTGVEVGFLGMVGRAAAAGAQQARDVSAYWDRCAAEKWR